MADHVASLGAGTPAPHLVDSAPSATPKAVDQPPDTFDGSKPSLFASPSSRRVFPVETLENALHRLGAPGTMRNLAKTCRDAARTVHAPDFCHRWARAWSSKKGDYAHTISQSGFVIAGVRAIEAAGPELVDAAKAAIVAAERPGAPFDLHMIMPLVDLHTSPVLQPWWAAAHPTLRQIVNAFAPELSWEDAALNCLDHRLGVLRAAAAAVLLPNAHDWDVLDALCNRYRREISRLSKACIGVAIGHAARVPAGRAQLADILPTTTQGLASILVDTLAPYAEEEHIQAALVGFIAAAPAKSSLHAVMKAADCLTPFSATPWVRDALLACLDVDDRFLSFRAKITRTLRRHLDVPEIAQRLGSLCEDKDDEVMTEALLALGRVSADDYATLLRAPLHRRPERAQELQARARDDADFRAYLLKDLSENFSRSALLCLGSSMAHEGVLEACVKALVRAGPHVDDGFETALAHTLRPYAADPVLQKYFVQALAKRDDVNEARARRHLAKCLRSPLYCDTARNLARTILATLPGPLSLEPERERLEPFNGETFHDCDLRNARHACATLAQLGGEAETAVLLEFLSRYTQDPVAQLCRASVLEQLQRPPFIHRRDVQDALIGQLRYPMDTADVINALAPVVDVPHILEALLACKVPNGETDFEHDAQGIIGPGTDLVAVAAALKPLVHLPKVRDCLLTWCETNSHTRGLALGLLLDLLPHVDTMDENTALRFARLTLLMHCKNPFTFTKFLERFAAPRHSP